MNELWQSFCDTLNMGSRQTAHLLGLQIWTTNQCFFLPPKGVINHHYFPFPFWWSGLEGPIPGALHFLHSRLLIPLILVCCCFYFHYIDDQKNPRKQTNILRCFPVFFKCNHCKKNVDEVGSHICVIIDISQTQKNG